MIYSHVKGAAHMTWLRKYECIIIVITTRTMVLLPVFLSLRFNIIILIFIGVLWKVWRYDMAETVKIVYQSYYN